MKVLSSRVNESVQQQFLLFSDLVIGLPIYVQGAQHGHNGKTMNMDDSVEGYITYINEHTKQIHYDLYRKKYSADYGHLKMTGQLPEYNLKHRLSGYAGTYQAFVTSNYVPKDLYIGMSVYAPFTAPRKNYVVSGEFIGNIESFDARFAYVKLAYKTEKYEIDRLTSLQMLADASMFDDQNDLQGPASAITARSNMDVLKFMSVLRKKYILSIPIDDFAGVSVDALREFDNDMIVALEKQGYVKTDMRAECIRYTRKFYTKVNLEKLFGISSDLATTNLAVIEFVRDCCKAKTIKEFLVAFNDNYDESFGGLRLIERDILKYTKHDLSGFIEAFKELANLGYVRQTPKGLAMTRQGLSYMSKAKL